MLDVTDLLVVIVGGGAVAARKAAGVLEAGGSRVRVVAPMFVPAMPTDVDRRVKRYASGDLTDADMVFAATDSAAVNDAVVIDAKAAGIWVSRADGSDASPGDFVTPAKFQQGSVLVTVSAGSAALAVKIRDGIEQRFDPAWSAMADAMARLRPVILSSTLGPVARRDLFRDLAGDDAMKILATGGPAALSRWVEQRTNLTVDLKLEERPGV